MNTARKARRARAAPRARRGEVTDHERQVREDDRKAARLARERAERSAKEAGVLKYLRTRNRRVYGAVTTLIREAGKAPAIMPALAEIVDYLEIESREQALIRAQRELRDGITREE